MEEALSLLRKASVGAKASDELVALRAKVASAEQKKTAILRVNLTSHFFAQNKQRHICYIKCGVQEGSEQPDMVSAINFGLGIY